MNSNDTTIRQAFIPADIRELQRQIGKRNILAISGGRVLTRETGITLPVSSGYSVTVDLAADDTYTVRRVLTRGTRTWIRGERCGVHAADVGEAAYYASCFRSYDEAEWPGLTAAAGPWLEEWEERDANPDNWPELAAERNQR